jgi:hypothetical protein
MTQDYKHPITPSPEQVQQWIEEAYAQGATGGEGLHVFAHKVAKWSADQELNECLDWLQDPCCADMPSLARDLKHSRRPPH